jgi:protein-L-isoaspartate(D-aspartate) O-methyltransferase
VDVITGNGAEGWPPAAPYDDIIVAAGAERIPDALISQLTPEGGRLLIPVGPRKLQTLMRIHRGHDGLGAEELDACAFVPLIGAEASSMH